MTLLQTVFYTTFTVSDSVSLSYNVHSLSTAWSQKSSHLKLFVIFSLMVNLC